MSDEFYGFDDDDDFDGCEHGVGFDEDCEDCEDDPVGCVYPGRCLMPGEHLESECHTAEMMDQIEGDPNAAKIIKQSDVEIYRLGLIAKQRESEAKNG